VNFGIGLSALRASQLAINTISNNLANASTEGYHRQESVNETRRSQRIGDHLIGSGVNVAEIRRHRDLVAERAVTNVTADVYRVEQSLSIESRIELLLSPGEGSIQNTLNGMFDGFSRLSANPGDVTLRESIFFEASNLAARLRETSGELLDMKNGIKQQVDVEIDELNLEIKELVDIQNRIRTTTDRQLPSDLLDRRDQLINQIAERVDVQRFESAQDPLGVALAGNSVILGVAEFRFEAVTNSDGEIQIQLENGDRALPIAGGRVAALLEANNGFIDGFSDQLDQFAGELIQHVDQLHAKGVGIDGPFDVLRGTRSVTDSGQPLSRSAAFDVTAGELFVTVTSESGERRTTGIAIDPRTDSLEDVANKLSGIDNVQAIVDSETGKLTVIAGAGFQFDFTGQLETEPDLGQYSGTAIPGISGHYEGSENETLTVVAVDSGDVGKTAGLALQLQNASGDVLDEFDVGDGYVAGSDISIGEGVSISLGVGSIVSGDRFDVQQVADSDTSNILSALGLNNFFEGVDSVSIGIDQRIRNSPNAFASSISGEVSDTRNLESLVGLRDTLVLDDETASLGSFFEDVNSQIGFRVQTTIARQESLSELKFQYESSRDSVSGVDVNEELINLTTHQKSYEAAIQVVRTMEQMVDELFRIIR
jgi:flagellar hook-associated protein FlgK